jgi:hypothetical protein
MQELQLVNTTCRHIYRDQRKVQLLEIQGSLLNLIKHYQSSFRLEFQLRPIKQVMRIRFFAS